VVCTDELQLRCIAFADVLHKHAPTVRFAELTIYHTRIAKQVQRASSAKRHEQLRGATRILVLCIGYTTRLLVLARCSISIRQYQYRHY
jgi:hypothetical protein